MILQNAPVLITGAARRIGAAIARDLAAAGMPVALHYGASEQEALGLRDQIRADGGRAEILQADLADPEAAAELVPRAAEAVGPLKALVNNAAIFEPGNFLTTDPANWERHLAINLTAPFRLMQTFARALPEGGGEAEGAVVNLLDQRIGRPTPSHTAYAAAKSALWTLTQMGALELAPAIRVNGIGPGPILPAPGDSDKRFRDVAAATPLQRPGSPAEIARTARFLLESDFITGEFVRVDGGEHL